MTSLSKLNFDRHCLEYTQDLGVGKCQSNTNKKKNNRLRGGYLAQSGDEKLHNTQHTKNTWVNVDILLWISVRILKFFILPIARST